MFGKKVAELRKGKGLTQKELARAADISESYVSAIEEGRAHPRFKTLMILAECLGVSVEVLIKEM